MNGSRKVIFSSIFTRLIESLNPHISLALSDFDNIRQKSQETPENIIDSFFQHFPRVIPLYLETITKLTRIAVNDLDDSVYFLTKTIKDVIQGSQIMLGGAQNFYVTYDANNKYHRLFLYYFSMLFITDLLCQIVATFDCSNSAGILSRAGYKVTESPQYVPNINILVVKQWSVIFSILSEKNYQTISQIFSLFTNFPDLTLPITLMRFIRLDVDDAMGFIFFDQIYNLLKNQIKKKTVTSLMLSSIAFMLYSLPFNEDIYQKMYSIVNPLRRDKYLWRGALFFMNILYMKYEKIRSKIKHFYDKRIFAMIGDKTKVKLSLECFKMAIMGRNVDPQCIFWEWGPNPHFSNLAFIQYNSNLWVSQTESFSPTSSFLNFYFPKADFTVCPRKFSHLIVHLASLNFAHFLQNVVPNFIELQPHDPRFSVFLMVVPLINSEDFIQHSFSTISKADIDQFNKKIHDKILQTLITNTPSPESKHGVCIRDIDFLMDSLSDEADQEIHDILEEWKIDKFEERNCKYIKCKPPENEMLLVGRLLKTLEFVFTNDDFCNEKVIRTLIEWSCNEDNFSATTAYSLCTNCLEKQVNLDKFIKNATDVWVAHRDAETTFIILNLIFHVFNNVDYKFDIEILRNIESTAFLVLASAYPLTRQLGIMILKKISELIGQQSFFSHIFIKMSKFEKTAKTKILLYAQYKNNENEPPPTSAISFQSAIISHYYTIWIFFLSEIINALITTNFTPIFSRIDSIRDKVLTSFEYYKKTQNPDDFGFLLILMSTQFHLKTLLSTSYYDFSSLYEPYPTNEEDKRPKICNFIYSMLSSDNKAYVNVGFQVLIHLNFSLQPPIIDVLAAVKQDQFENAAWCVSYIIRQPELDKKFFKHNLFRIISFLTNIQYHLIKTKMNSPRIVQWNEELEKHVLEHINYAKNFCLIVYTTFRFYNHAVSTQDWPISHRTLIIRFFVNWALTTKDELSSLRRCASMALVMIVKLGPVLDDKLMINDAALSFFGSLERQEMPILNNLLNFHLEILMPIFIDACYTQPCSNADLYFESIVHCCHNIKNYDLMILILGPLLFLSHVYAIKEHPHASLLIEQIISISEKMDISSGNESFHEQNPPIDSLPSIFSYATEAVFSSFFKVMHLPNLHIPVNFIIDAIKPWFSAIRLLPTQTSVVVGVLPQFNYFTPYEFLSNLMKVTESVNDDQFRLITSLWTCLFQSPDHIEIVPLFMSEWENFQIKKRLFEVLLENEILNLSERTSRRCSFAFYFHVTRWRHHTFTTEQQWMSQLLANLVNRNFSSIKKNLPLIVNFSFLFREKGARKLFFLLCRNMGISCYEGSIPPQMMRKVVMQFLKCMNIKNIIKWGNEALTWFVGSSFIPFSYLSLLIYNQIMKPFDEELIGLVIKIVAYHIDLRLNNSNSNASTNSNDKKPINNAMVIDEDQQAKYLCYLVSESFIFFTNIFEKHEEIAFNYASTFLDVRFFFESSLRDALPLFLKAIRNSDSHSNIDNQMIISIIRPLIPILADDSEAQGIFDDLIKKYEDNYELQMIVAPIKMTNHHLFPSSKPFEDVFEKANETALCKSLVHYSMMIQYSNYKLQDAIYEICSLIIDKVQVNDNNKLNIAKIYQISLNSLNRCANAFKLMKSIFKFMPDVSVINVYDSFEWDRSLEDVSRNLKILAKKVEIPIQNITITECNNYKTIANVLFSNQIPKVLPYAAQEEMLQAMSKVKKNHSSPKNKSNASQQNSYSRDNASSSFYSLPNSVSVVFTESTKGDIFDLTPIYHPEKLLFDNKGIFDIEKRSKKRKTELRLKDFLTSC